MSRFNSQLYMRNQDIADFTGVSSRIVSRWRVEHGLKRRPSVHEFLIFAAQTPKVGSKIVKDPCFDMLDVYRKAYGK